MNKNKKILLFLALSTLLSVFLLYNFDASTFRVSTLNQSAEEKEDEGTLTAAPVLEKGNTGSWFKFTVEPGNTLEGKIAVINQKKHTAMGGLIYAVDVNSDGGGFSPQARDYPKTDSTWITIETPEIILKPGEEKIIPFAINIPKSATPGEHAIAIMVEPKTADKISEADGNVQLVSVQTRMGIRVYITVKGEIITAAKIGEPSFVEENPVILKIPVTNTGNSKLKPNMEVTIFDKDNKKIDDITSNPSYEIFPGGTLNLEAKWEKRKTGNYKAKFLISYADKTETREFSFNIKPPSKIKRSTALKPTAVETTDTEKLSTNELLNEQPILVQTPLAKSPVSSALIIIGVIIFFILIAIFAIVRYFKRKQLPATLPQQPVQTPPIPPLLPKQ